MSTFLFLLIRSLQILRSSTYSFAVHCRGGHGGLQYCGIGLFFMLYFGNFDFNVRYCGIIRPCGMRYFIILADDIRGNMFVHGIAVRLFAFSFRYNTQNKTQ